MQKTDILSEIRRTAKENGGTPLGRGTFEKETGIKPYDWGQYWSRFGDAQKEAGFTPNQLKTAYSDEFIFEKMVGLIRKLGKFPTYGELRLEKNNDAEFPHGQSFFDSKQQKQKLASKLIEQYKDKADYSDVVALCQTVIEEQAQEKDSTFSAEVILGEVYLFKSGRYYKIGMTKDTVRRGTEIRILLPEKLELMHSIKTDDPSGVEAYWHRRFDAKRKNGSEWFVLNGADVKAFKRWRRIY